MKSFQINVQSLLEAAGFKNYELISHVQDEKHFGNSEAVFKIGVILLRFILDRGQAFIDVASTVNPARFYQYDTVQLAMGWNTIEDILTRNHPVDLEAVLLELAQNYRSLEIAMSKNNIEQTAELFEKADKARGEAFVKKINKNIILGS